MKVGTDGVLLGVWAYIGTDGGKQRLLDIGTGTGLISLMAAQRNASLLIDAIEIEPHAALQAEENAKNSIFAAQIQVFTTSLQNFRVPYLYDIILANPPFFQTSYPNENEAKRIARHTDSLSYEDLLANASRLLAETGHLGLILPYPSFSAFCELGEKYGLFLDRWRLIIPRKGIAPKRVLMQFSKNADTVAYQEPSLTLLTDDNKRTDEYQSMTNDFYLYPI